MALPDTYSRRKRLSQGAGTDVFEYVSISLKLKHQIIQIFREIDNALKDSRENYIIYSGVVNFLRKEFGVPQLYNAYGEANVEFDNWLLNENDIDNLLDGIEAAADFSDFYGQQRNATRRVKSSLEELNARMFEAGLGFQLSEGQIIRADSQFTHSSIVLPALTLLADPAYKVADTEFRKAHEEYRAGDYEDCIADCGNALESTLKIILTRKGWLFSPNDTASKLIGAAFSNGLIPLYLQSEFVSLRSLLESGTPTVRNKAGGHGAGATPRSIPAYLAAFQLNQTAAAILLLAEAAK